jgi:phosphonopyruvate decarboxylase
MVNSELFIKTLYKNGIDFYTGVPDSLLKNICAYITDNIDAANHIIAANEGNAVGLASGYHLSTGKIAMVYMQNSGEGNIINPILSLADDEVYGIPMLLLIGWRGEPGVHDEPQHIKQGKVTLDLLDAMQISYSILSDNDFEVIDQISYATEYMKLNNRPYALIVKKGTFAEYKLKNVEAPNFLLSREDAIKTVVDNLNQTDIVVSTTGMISRELFEYRENLAQGHANDFLTVGSMGHANQIALGIAIQKKDRRVFCFDGDGAILMHLGGMAIIGNLAPHNYIHIVFNNGAHDSVGGQPTVGQKIKLTDIAEAMGYKSVFSIDNKEELQRKLSYILNEKNVGPIFININVMKGNRKDLGRPTTSPKQNKEFFMNNLK